MHVDDESPTPSTPSQADRPAPSVAATGNQAAVAPGASGSPATFGAEVAENASTDGSDRRHTQGPPGRSAPVHQASASRLAAPLEEPPVVVRLVVEIRSDGSRTIARGAAEDALSGEKVALEVAGNSPLQLALSLMKTLTQIPSLARGNIRHWLPSRRR